MEIELRKAEARGNTETLEQFAAKIRGKVDEHRKGRIEQMQTLSYSDPLQAYKEAQAFVASFPQAPEKASPPGRACGRPRGRARPA
jgi:hypothetical protein